jgi:hypothetical protein
MVFICFFLFLCSCEGNLFQERRAPTPKFLKEITLAGK